MADNLSVTPAGVTTTVATDDVAGVQYQKIKLVDGTADSTTGIPGDGTNGLDVDVTRVQGGNVAHNAADSGNPIKTGGVYNSAAPTLDSGDRGDSQMDVNGNTKTTLGGAIAGEDFTNDVLKTEAQYSSSGVKTSDTQIKASAGFVHTISFAPNDATPTAGSIILYDNTAESGTQIFNWNVQATAFIPFTITLDMVCTTGIYLGFTTTADVNVTISYR